MEMNHHHHQSECKYCIDPELDSCKTFALINDDISKHYNMVDFLARLVVASIDDLSITNNYIVRIRNSIIAHKQMVIIPHIKESVILTEHIMQHLKTNQNTNQQQNVFTNTPNRSLVYPVPPVSQNIKT